MVKTKLIELLDLIEKDLELSEWSKKLTLKNQHQWFLKEVEELKEALAKGDMDNYGEELGDALWDLLKLIVIAEKEGVSEAREIVDNIRKKIIGRKPHLSDGRILTADEEEKLWREIKAKEKNESISNHR